MDTKSKQFSRSRDTYHRTSDKISTQKHYVSQYSKSPEKNNDFQEYLKSQCHDLVCEVEEYRHNEEMSNCTIKFLTEQVNQKHKEVIKLTQVANDKQITLEQLQKKYSHMKQQYNQAKEHLEQSKQNDRKERHLMTKTHDEIMYLNDKLVRIGQELDQLKEENRQLRDECIKKEDDMLELQRHNGLLMRELEQVKGEIERLSEKETDVNRQVDSLTKRLSTVEKQKLDFMSRTRQLEKQRNQLHAFRTQKQSIDNMIRDREKQIENLAMRLQQEQIKGNQLAQKYEKIAFELKKLETQKNIERAAYESQMAVLRDRVMNTVNTEAVQPSYQLTQISKDRHRNDIRVIESLPSEQSMYEDHRKVGGISRKATPNMELQRLIGQYEAIKQRGHEKHYLAI